jgi:Flp pilus assembly protein TadG
MLRKLTGKQKSFGGMRAQAIVEFAIALPVLLLLLVGIMEAGRMLFMYASAVNASRDAVRFASAYGKSDSPSSGYLKYKYCTGIRNAAQKSGFFLQNPTITIKYDGGPSTSVGSKGTCDLFASPWEDPDISVDTGDRVMVTVSVTYAPIMNKLLPFGTRTFTATSSRTILGVIDLDN